MKKCYLLTLDIWDTILRRKCHPDEIKIITSRYLFLSYYSDIKEEFRNVKRLTELRVECEVEIGQKKTSNDRYDDEYCICDVFALLCRKIFDSKTDKEKIISELYQYELNAEKENIYLDTSIVRTINEISYSKIAYISDFYAGKEFMDELLAHVQFPKNFDYKYISCERGYNKRSGRLFDCVLNDIGISPEEQIHIGDNEHSDYNIPKSKGISCIRYLPEEDHLKRRECEVNFEDRKRGNVRQYFSKLSPDLNITGSKASIFYYNFVLWIIEECIKNNISKVYYFTREGEFFKEIHDEILINSPFFCKLPKSYILEVSRIATFGASLREVTLQEMMRIWNQYSIQSMKAFFKSVNIEKDAVMKFLEKYNIPYDDDIIYPWQDERVQNMFADLEFIEIFQNNINKLREGFLAYGATKDLNLDENEKIAIVDIGWRGTIQDNICYIYDKKAVYGYYLGLIDFLNEQPKNSFKFGFLNGCNYAHLILRYVTPLEMLCNSPNGSVIGYENINGNTIAIRKNDPNEDVIFKEYTEKVQTKILEVVEYLTKQTKIHGLVSEDIKNVAYENIYDIISNPSIDFAEAYFSLKHNEEFGVGKYINKHTNFKLMLMIKAVFSKKSRQELKSFLDSTTWPQGYLTKYKVNYARKRYNQIQEKKK